MKKIFKSRVRIIFLSALLLASSFTAKNSIAQQWIQASSSTIQDLRSVHFISSTQGWAVGNNGIILTTSNGGLTWTTQTSGTTEYLNTVHFISSTQGWIVGTNGTILVTNNGGITWTAQTSNTVEILYSVYFVSSTQGWAVGNNGIILTTSNGGLTWTTQTSGTMQFLSSVYFISSTQGWIVGSNGTILVTNNGGVTWIAQTSGTTTYFRSIYFISSTQGWAVGTNGIILTTSNGGITWTAQTSGSTQIFYSVHFISSTQGWIVGTNGTILVTNNGGLTWTVQTSGTTQILYSVYFTSSTQGWAVGASGTILFNCISPSIVTQPISQTTCNASQASFTITATGEGLTYQWKKETINISGATASSLVLNNVSAADAANYSCVITGTCGTVTSNAVSLTVQTTTAPTTTAQSFCASQTPTVALLTASGTAIKWYSASSGGTALVSNTILTTATYYASQTVNACEGPRASASITIQSTTAPTTTAQTFCLSQNPSVAQLTATGTAIKWYTSASGGTALSGLVALSTGTYYASQTVNGCEGPRASTSITVQTTAIPSATTQSFCGSQNPTVAQLTATGTAIKWYTVSNGGTALSASTALATGTYYASQTINGCESNTIPVSVSLTSATYALSNVDAVCSSSFSVPLQTVGAIKSGLIGLDFTLNYDQTLVTPSGTASLGAVAASYGDYSLNTSTPGKVVVSVYIKNAPSNTFFNGTGNVIGINFTVNAGVAINTSGALTTSLIEESTVIGAATSCNASSSTLKVVGVVGGKIIYRDDVNNDLGYDASSPALYAPTVITGYGSTCSAQVGASVMPNNVGIFGYYPGNGSQLKIERDVKGNFNLPPLECTNVQAVINSADYQLALTIANSSYATPSLYELMTADVNQDGKVTAGDVSLISSRSINQYNCEFPQAWNYEWNGTSYVPKPTYAKSKDWIFVPDVYATSPSFVLNMGRNKVPQLPACLPLPPGVATCTANANTIYHALLLGDVNANWTKAANGSQLREIVSKEIFFDLPNAIVNGSTKTIPVYYSGETSFSGIDFSIDYIVGITITGLNGADGVAVQWNNIGNQRLMVSAYANEKLTGNYPVLYLTVSTNDALTSESFSSATGYLNGEEANMRFDESSAANVSSGIHAEIFPNPSNGITYLYTTDAAAFVKVSIYHTNGTLVYENANVAANENAALPELKAGVYIVKVSGSSGETTKKLVRY
ncbi:MAG: Cadherin-like beta sandwich protein [Chitinophagaceae bacterium]|nr:Cadherin-like beta sandwich protein [Chitinophagaceae bacterium]